MKSTAVILFVAFIATFLVLNSANPEPCKQCPPNASCLRVSPNDCQADEIYVREDGCRFCCNTCAKKRGKSF